MQRTYPVESVMGVLKCDDAQWRRCGSFCEPQTGEVLPVHRFRHAFASEQTDSFCQVGVLVTCSAS